jgi:transcriptional regulator with XRE-family HTH domain
MSSNINSVIGELLKEARAANGWSLDVTYNKTGVSKAMLGQIERGESSPTIAKLWKIANGFELPISYFLGAFNASNIAKNELKTEKGITVVPLFPFDPVTNFEVLSLTLMPLHQQNSEPHNSGVIEHILVIKGEMEYLLDEEWHALKEGEVIKFKADKAHGYRNLSDKATTFHNIIYYAKKNNKGKKE